MAELNENELVYVDGGAAGLSASENGPITCYRITIQPGDNLTKIASRYNTTVECLIQLNSKFAKNPNLIYAGDTMLVPAIIYR